MVDPRVKPADDGSGCFDVGVLFHPPECDSRDAEDGILIAKNSAVILGLDPRIHCGKRPNVFLTHPTITAPDNSRSP